jgi:hypothetical protein
LLPRLVAALYLLPLLSCGLQEHPRGRASPTPGPIGGFPGPSNGGGSAGSAGVSGAGGGVGAGGRSGSGGGSGRDAGDRDAQPASEPPGSFVDIAGIRVPREKAIVFIHFGHSNMAGHGRNPPELRPFFYDIHPRLWSYQGAGRFVPATEPTAPDGRVYAGPGMALLRTAVQSAAPDAHFISIARGKGSATTADFLKGSLYYSSFMTRALELRGRVTFGAVFIMLGITDRHMPLAQQGGFPDRVATLVADIRRDLEVPDLPVLHTDYEVESTGTLSVDSEFARRIRPLILSLPMRIPHLSIVPTDGAELEDDHHFTMAGHKLWAERAIHLLGPRSW